DKLSELGIAFSKNISSSNDFLIVEEKDMDGCPDDYKKARKQEDGKYKIDMSYPSYSGFMKSSTSESARKALYMKYNNRAVDKNLDVLNEMLTYRQKMASLLGYKTFAQYQVEERMAKKPSNVWDFEKKTLAKVKAKAQKDYQELLATKRNYLKDNTVQVVNTWESSFYNNILLKEKYQLDQELVKEYFELNHVMDGLFKISQHLFNVKFVEIKDASVWQPDVRAFEVRQDEKVIGRFFLDLHPRANKYNHAACFTMIRGKMTSNGYQIPTATLVCNFPQATADQPGLMYHSLGSASVETFFHEFGHVLHNMLTTSELYTYAGTGVARDFVEAPSQIFENWAWNYDAVKMFAKHYKTGEVLPKDLFDKMVAAKNVGSGIGAAYQIYYGMLDMTLHDGFDPSGKETTTDIVKRLQNEITPFQFVEGTHFHAAFGHLNGYAAGYYGYLWAEVYATDMFS
ncbi:Zn-dependent oligopeptidase, partial [bacterium]|nr:Zn-dependent oligopeptidase [bacterium]